MCDGSCAEAIHFLYIVQFDLRQFQRFCFHRSSCHSFNTLLSWCAYKINHCTEFITGQKFLVSFSYQGVSYIEGVETTFGLWSFLIIYTKQPTNSELGIYKWLDKNVSHVLNLRTLNSVYIYGLNQNLSHVLNPRTLNSAYIHG